MSSDAQRSAVLRAGTAEHLRVRETLARQRRRRLDPHGGADGAPVEVGSRGRQQEHRAQAKRTRARVAAVSRARDFARRIASA